MNAQTKLASRFSTPADPMEMLRVLQGLCTPDAAPDDDFDPDADAPESAVNESQPDDPPPKVEPAAAEPKSGRESNGRFAKGNEGGPGNPFNRQVAALRKQLLDAMTPAVFQMTIEALVCQACTGDVAALKLLYQYTLGKPAEAKDPDRVALEEVQLLRESNAGGRDWRDLTGAPFLETFLQSVRALQVISTERFQERFAGMLAGLQADEDRAARQQEAQRARREARRARAAAVNPEVDAASRAASNPAGPAEQPKATAPSANRPDGAVASEPGAGEPGALATGVHRATAGASSGRSRSRLAHHEEPATEAGAPSANGPDGVPRKRRGPETRAERGSRARGVSDPIPPPRPNQAKKMTRKSRRTMPPSSPGPAGSGDPRRAQQTTENTRRRR